MYGTYAVKYEGKEVGTLKVYSEGLMTVFAAETLPLSGVWRIAVVSKGKTIPIGVLAPSQRGLYLKKNFTKNMLAELNVSGIEAVVLLSQEHPRIGLKTGFTSRPVARQRPQGRLQRLKRSYGTGRAR